MHHRGRHPGVSGKPTEGQGHLSWPETMSRSLPQGRDWGDVFQEGVQQG